MMVKRWILAFLSALPLAGMAEQTVYRRTTDRVASLDPAMGGTVYASRASQLVYETLYEFDYKARPYRLITCLAAEMPVIKDGGLTYEIRLVPDALFHDDPCFPGGKGRRVTAEDVVYSFMRIGDSRITSPGSWLVMDTIRGMRDYAEATKRGDASAKVAGLTAVSDDTVRIELTKPIYAFTWFLAMSYLSVIPHEAVETYGDDFGFHPVGTGPYRLESWRRNHQFQYVRVPSWRGWTQGPAAIRAGERVFDVVQYNIVDDVSTQWLCFLNGELDFLGDISRDNWDVVIDGSGGLTDALKSRGVSLFSIPTMEIAYVGINMEDPVLGKNKALRQALNCAFDTPAWIRFMNNRVLACNGPVPPGTEGYLDDPFPYAFNLQRAKELLKQAGYENGIDPKTGRRLELTLDLGRTSQDIRESTELMVSFYDRVGIALRPQYHNWPAVLQMCAERRSPMFRIAWLGDYPDAENFLQLFYSKNASPGPNRCNYANPDFDRLYEQACSETDPAKRTKLWEDAQRIIREDCPWIFLHYPKAFSLTGPRVLGYTPSDFSYGTEKYLRLRDKTGL